MTSSVPEKSHSSLGASIANRWMNCPGSVALAATCPPSPTTIYAREGTAAHALAELCLKKGTSPDLYVGMTIEGWVVDDDMAENVRVFVDHCRNIPGHGDDMSVEYIEFKFNLAALGPPAAMYGTVDHAFYDASSRTLHISDLKYGMGLVVEAKGNKQLRYYALGAALDLRDVEDFNYWVVDQVTMWIVQPRASHPDGVIRSETISYAELMEFGAELIAAAKATQQPDALLNPGSHCRFCPASGACPAQHAQAVALAQIDFAAIEPLAPKPPELLDDTELAKVLAIAPMVSEWLTAARAVVERRLAAGESFPGYKLVERAAHRRWVNESDTEQWLRAQGFETDEIAVTKLKSPAQIEKLVGKKKLPSERTTKNSGSYVMVPKSDKRPAIASIAAVEFTALESGEE